MEKITLKPVVKELLYKTDEVNTHVDVLSYSGTTTQEKTLGSLYLIGHVKYDEEDLGYVISLVSSLAKREYYSEQALKSQDPKKSFEGTLKKLNEILQDFFKNKSFALNLGLAAIAGDQLYISKLGKFKVGLARNGEHIDVLNNIALFQKSAEDEQQFSNIISGKLQPGDKLFAYYPARPITSREKMLQTMLVKEPQEQFLEKISQLAEHLDTFTCCGVHIAIEQIKEIPLDVPATATLASQPGGPTADSVSGGRTAQVSEKPRVIAAELSVSKKGNVISSLSNVAGKLKSMDRLPIHSRFKGFIIIALVVFIPLLSIVLIRSGGDAKGLKAAYANGAENLKSIHAKLAQNDTQEARSLIQQTLAQIQPFESEKISELRKELEKSMDSVDHVSSLVPKEVGTAEATGIVLAFENNTPSVVYNRSEVLTVKDKTYTLQDPVTATDATLYEGNLYTLAGNNLYKYADALAGGTKRSDWGTPEGVAQSIAVDGNLFVLTNGGKVETYFKGKKESEFDPSLPVNEQNQIVTSKDATLIYLANPVTKRLYALDKTNGSLQTTYKLDNIGELKDITVSADGSIWLLSKDYKVWQLSF
ncbi:MAG: hypothetical protein AAB420_02140 [Patescibacteria group bacterium]